MSIICVTACNDFSFVSSDGLMGSKSQGIYAENTIKTLEVDGKFIVGATGTGEIIQNLFSKDSKSETIEEAIQKLTNESIALESFKQKYPQDNAKDVYNILFELFAGPGKMKHSNQILVTGLDSNNNVFVGVFNSDFEERVIDEIIEDNKIISFALMPSDLSIEDYPVDHFQSYFFERVKCNFASDLVFFNESIERRIAKVRTIHRRYIKLISNKSDLVNKNIRHHKVIK